MSDFERHLVLEGSLAPLASLEARGQRRRRMENLFELLGRRHARTLRTPIDFSSGEVFQALIRSPQRLPSLLAELHHELHDHGHHLGLGWGDLSTPLSGRVRRMDGPAFDRASQARVAALENRAWAKARGFGEEMDTILDGHFLLLGQVQDSWKAKQRETVAIMRRVGRRREVAIERDVQPSTVTRSLEGAFYSGVRGLEDSLALLLDPRRLELLFPSPPESPGT